MLLSTLSFAISTADSAFQGYTYYTDSTCSSAEYASAYVADYCTVSSICKAVSGSDKRMDTSCTENGNALLQSAFGNTGFVRYVWYYGADCLTPYYYEGVSISGQCAHGGKYLLDANGSVIKSYYNGGLAGCTGDAVNTTTPAVDFGKCFDAKPLSFKMTHINPATTTTTMAATATSTISGAAGSFTSLSWPSKFTAVSLVGYLLDF